MTLKKLLNLKGRRALVTGATGHLGQVICETLAEMGADLILVDLPGAKFKKLQSSLKKKWKIKSQAIPCDLELEDQRAKMLKTIQSDKQGLSILVNNAAFVGTAKLPGWAVSFEKQSLATWRRVFEVNLTAPFHLSQALAPQLQAAKGGNIINITSIYSEYGPDWNLYDGTSMGNPAAYGVSKGGLAQLTRWLASTLAPAIRVNCISPGGILRDQPRKFVKRYIKKSLLSRMAKENDIRGAIAYLASDASAYVTGQTVRIDGGWRII